MVPGNSVPVYLIVPAAVEIGPKNANNRGWLTCHWTLLPTENHSAGDLDNSVWSTTQAISIILEETLLASAIHSLFALHWLLCLASYTPPPPPPPPPQAFRALLLRCFPNCLTWQLSSTVLALGPPHFLAPPGPLHLLLSLPTSTPTDTLFSTSSECPRPTC